MKGFGLAFAALLSLAVGPAAADFVEIIVDLSKIDQLKGPGNQGGAVKGGNPNPKGNDKAGLDPLHTIKVVLDAKKIGHERMAMQDAGGGGAAQPNIQILTLLALDHEWGRTWLVPSDLINYKELNIQSVAKKYETERKKAVKSKSQEEWLALAGWVLKHGRVKEFPKIMADLEKVAPKDPAVLAFKKVQAAMKSPPREDEPTSLWIQNKRKSYTPYSSAGGGHYKLLSKIGDKKLVESYLERLEETYQAFFYWFALKGMVLQVPHYRLVAVLISDNDEFDNHRMIFPTAPMAADGFTARRDNVAILSSKPLIPLFQELDQENQKYWAKGGIAGKEALLKGGRGKPSSFELANVQALALVQKLMEEQGQWATETHEGVLQLMAACGMPTPDGSSFMPMMPRNLLNPEWVRCGVASFFETPREAFFPGFSAVNLHFWLRFKEANEAKKLDNPEEVVESVITDRLFRDARTIDDWEKLEFARTISWSLAYYIAEKKGPDKLIKYFQLIAQLPRDMEVDGPILKGLFIQAFGDLKTFAREWKSEMVKVTVEGLPGGQLLEAFKRDKTKIKAAIGKGPNPLVPRPNGPVRPIRKRGP